MCVLASLVFILMAYVFAFWFPPRGHDGGMPTSAQNANLHAPARACALPPPRPGSVPFEFLAEVVADRTCFCVFPTPRPRSSHTGDAAALQTWPKYSSGEGGADRASSNAGSFFLVGLSTPPAVWALKGRFREAGSIEETAKSAPFSGCGCARTSPNLFFTPQKHGPN